MLEIEETIRKQKLERERALLDAIQATPEGKNLPELVEPSRNQDAQPSDSTLPTPNVPVPSVQEAPTPMSDSIAMGEALLLADVMASTYRAFPQIEIARQQAGIARGEITTSLGAYDVHLDYFTINQPVGFYENSRSGVALERRTWWGGYVDAGYRIGRGSFEPWYKERETNGGGELFTGLVQPLLQGLAIDPYRVQLFQSNLNRQAVQPEIQLSVLIAGVDAARVYWMWVEAGNALLAQERLLQLAVQRNAILEKLFERGLSTRQELSINAQTISERQLVVFKGRQKFRDMAFKLALYLRDEAGNPMLAAPEWLPPEFPALIELPAFDFEADFAAAQLRRPELQLISIDIQKLQWDLELARNQTLPTVDLQVRGAQDMGTRASLSDDKQDFMLETALVGGVPVQRRKARGKIDTTLAKIQQSQLKLELQTNKIEVELRSAANALVFSRQMAERSAQLVQETRETLGYFQRDFAAGNRDFLFLLQQEARVTESEIKLLQAEQEFFFALAALQATLGLDPLEQSLMLNQLGTAAPTP